MKTTDIAGVTKDISTLDKGIVDTSTLIYLTAIDMLFKVSSHFLLFVLPQVRSEYGKNLPHTLCEISGPEGPADTALVSVAEKYCLPVFSEDKKILQAADRSGCKYYNSLMLILSLYARQVIDHSLCRRKMDDLSQQAHYSNMVCAYGEQVFQYIMQTTVPGSSS